MQVNKPNTPPTAGLKRERMQSFPGAFEEQLLRLFAARSALLQAQLECFDAMGSRLQLPEGIGSLWLECILTPPPELQHVNDATIAAYLKASAFFQDSYMVEFLCSMLRTRLFNVLPEAAGTSADQQPATLLHIDQVLGQLSSDLVMEVLRSAPGALQEQLPRLPRSLASIAALAHIPSLAAICSPVPECADQGASEGHTALTLCVCTRPTDPVAVASADEKATDSIAGASMWLQRAANNYQNVDAGLFTLESRPGVVVCRLLARVSALQGVTVALPDYACLLLGPGTLKLQSVTVQGGAVVCSGASCQATFADPVFDRCSLLVLSAAQATLSNAAFKNMQSSQSRLAMLVHGVSSRVAVQGGTVAGGTQAVAVQAGGHLEATGLTIAEVETVGAEVQGEDSVLSFIHCELGDFADEVDENGSEEEPVTCALGVHVHSRGSAHLSSLSVSGRHSEGVRVASSASATLVDCNVSASADVCVRVCDSGTGRLTGCTLSEGHLNGLQVHGAGSNVHATKCHFRQTDTGAIVSGGATLTAVACKSSQNSSTGFAAIGQASVVDLTDCASDRDRESRNVCDWAALRATRVKVTNSSMFGYNAGIEGHMVLTDCSAESCGAPGVIVGGPEAKAHVEGCTFKQNGENAVLAADHAEVTVKSCHSSQHSEAGYSAIEGAQMKVSSSVSEGDEEGCHADGGQLTMEKVTVDGALQCPQPALLLF